MLLITSGSNHSNFLQHNFLRTYHSTKNLPLHHSALVDGHCTRVNCIRNMNREPQTDLMAFISLHIPNYMITISPWIQWRKLCSLFIIFIACWWYMIQFCQIFDEVLFLFAAAKSSKLIKLWLCPEFYFYHYLLFFRCVYSKFFFPCVEMRRTIVRVVFVSRIECLGSVSRAVGYKCVRIKIPCVQFEIGKRYSTY